jgi:hypothetical protein
VTESFSTEPWHDLFVGVAGAAAALTGLLFVSLSINLQHILAIPALPRRAALTLVMLFESLQIAILGLIARQSRTALGAELLAVGVSVWLFTTGGLHVPAAGHRAAGAHRRDAILAQFATLPVIVAGRACSAAVAAAGSTGSCRRSCCCSASAS